MAEKGKRPTHVGIILDGNRRFAKRIMAKPWMGHEWGFKKFKQSFEWAVDLDIKEFTLYCFSMQNFNRPKEEFDHLMDIFRRAAKQALENKDVHEKKIRVNPIGRWHLFPKDVVEALTELKEKTKDYDKYCVNLCMAYGGREEIMELANPLQPESPGRPVLVGGGTFSANPASMAAGLATMDALRKKQNSIYELLAARGDAMREGIIERFKACGLPVACTGKGSLFMTHILKGEDDGISSPRDIAEKTHASMADGELKVALLNHGVFSMHGGAELYKCEDCHNSHASGARYEE